MNLPSASREELFRRLQIARMVGPIIEAQVTLDAAAAWAGTDGNARAADWHVSFHASQFPLDAETACGRKALYSLMALPGEPASPMLVATSEAGLDIERRVLGRFERAGCLLSSIDPTKQTNFAIKRYWLT